LDAYPVIVAGSTHATEEEALFNAFGAIAKEYPKAVWLSLLVKPADAMKLNVWLKNTATRQVIVLSSKICRNLVRKDPVLLIDTIGELGRIYAVGDVVFVGGSLVHHGGHNVLEPAAHAKPILVGPSMENFKDSYSLLSKVGACRMIKNTDELAEAFLRLLKMMR
jgi:3-deoxy-D-manno-octulosonic-acid transferase